MDRIDWLLIALAVAYLAVTALGIAGSDLHSSADRVAEGDLWLLLTSALNVVPELDVPQWFLLAASITVVIWRCGPKLWWSVALAGHVGAAVISYIVIGLAVAIGSGSADTTASESDYGVSIVLAATLGALAASGFAVPSERRTRGDKVCIGLGLLGLAGMIAFSVGWYDMQHVLGYAIGFVFSGWLMERRIFAWRRPRTG